MTHLVLHCITFFLANSNTILQFLIAKSLKRCILGASTIIISKDIDKYAFMCGSNFYETDVSLPVILCEAMFGINQNVVPCRMILCSVSTFVAVSFSCEEEVL